MFNKIKKLFKGLGPGFITGASDDDPSGIATYSQTGAAFGYNQLWTAIFTFPFMTAMQEICARIGLITGKGLAGVIRRNYSKAVLYPTVSLLLIANIINISADLGAMAAAVKLLINVDYYFLLIAITLTTIILQIFVPYKTYSKYLKILGFTLIAYIISAFVIKLDWKLIALKAVLPEITFSKEYFLNILAVFGTTISPYLFFWQAGEEVEEEVEENKLNEMGHGTPDVTKKDIRQMRRDTFWGMLFSNVVMLFIIIVAASTLHANGIFAVNSAAEAAATLRPLAGDLAFLLFSLGIIGTGLLAIPVLAGSASYAVSETFGWREGLYRKPSQARHFYAIIAISTIVGLIINFTHIPPFKMLYLAAVINGIVSPFLMVTIMRISNDKKILGNYTNSKTSNIIGSLITLIMFLALIGFPLSLL